MVRRESVKVGYSKNNERLLELLKSAGYIENFEKKGKGPKKILSVKLRYKNDKGAISGIRLLSKPSRRLYVGHKDIRPVKNGFGTLVISTPKGILTGKEAKRFKVGGETWFEIW